MSAPESPRSGGSHRATGSAAGAGESPPPLLLPLLSALVVLGAIGLAAWMLVTSGDDGDQTSPPAGASQPTTQPPATASTSPSTEPTDDNGGGDKGGDKGDKGGDKGDTGGDKGDTSSSTPVPQIPVYVFNQTTVTGLAAETAAQMQTKGWNVVGVDNWIGTVPEDTVYYYPGDRAAAERLSQEFPGVGRVWPASAPMPQGALTVILADATRK